MASGNFGRLEPRTLASSYGYFEGGKLYKINSNQYTHLQCLKGSYGVSLVWINNPVSSFILTIGWGTAGSSPVSSIEVTQGVSAHYLVSSSPDDLMDDTAPYICKLGS